MRGLLFLVLLIVAVVAAVKRGNYSDAVPTEVWIVQLANGTDPHAVALQMGFTYLKEVAGYHAFRRLPASDSRRKSSAAIDEAMGTDPRVIRHERQIARQQQHRSPPVKSALAEKFGADAARRIEEQKARAKELRDSNTYNVGDPLYPEQWHLRAIGNTSVANVAADLVWNRHRTYRGSGSIIAIVDDGLNYMHPDIHGNYANLYSYDFNGDNRDPMASHGDTHGTSAAGVAAAMSNDVCGVGICPECVVAAMKLIAGPSSDYMEAEALGYESDAIQVYSNSWGPIDDGKTMAGPGYVTKAMLAQKSVSGRTGKGSIYVWAGGNGAQNGDNANYDSYANSRFTIAVGAIGADGKKAYYSEDGACIMVSAPSSGTPGRGITTVYTVHNGEATCTNAFGGTSAAAPLVAGGIALVLGKFPNLYRRDVLHLLALSSSQIDASDPDWTPKTMYGVRHSHKYGWGMLNMMEFTRLAINWLPVPQEQHCSTGRVPINYQLGETTGDYNWHIELGASIACRGPGATANGGAIDFVEYVEVTAWISHGSRGDLLVDLSGPDHVVSHLQIPHQDHSAYPSEGWTYGSARHFSRRMHGIWNVHVADTVRNGIRGTLQALRIDVYGYAAPPQ